MTHLRQTLNRALDTKRHGGSDRDDLNPGFAPPATHLIAAGVLAAFHADDGRLVLTKRSSALRHHPGQIALPGGKVDPSDADATAAALREAHEEVGLNPVQVEVLGLLPPLSTVTGFAMAPVIALVHGDFIPVAEGGEVDEVFTLPFGHVTNPARYRVERRHWSGSWRAYKVAPFGPYYLWGATARVLFELAQRIHHG